MISEKEQVKQFWESNPLMTGELSSVAGSREFFEAHEAIYKTDIFPRGIPEELFPFSKGGKVLDVGCGVGIWTRALAKRGYQVNAIDLTNNAVELTKKSLHIFNLSADVQVGDAEQIPFPNNYFDGVVSHGVIHHTPNTAQCVREIARVLKPQGIAVVSVYYRNMILRSTFLTKLTALLFAKFIKLPGRGRETLLKSGDPNEIVRIYDGADNPIGKAYTTAEFKKMFTDAGFTVVNTSRHYFPKRAFGPFKFLIAPLHNFLTKRCGLLIYITAQKNNEVK